MRRFRTAQESGFTLVETIVAVSIVGLILTLVGLEFVGTVNHMLHTRAQTDAESQARVIMSKIDTQMRSAYFDWTDFPLPSGSPLAVVSPQPAPSASADYIAFYRVSAGGMPVPVPTASPGTINAGAPAPPYDLVTIQMSTTKPGELDEIISPPLGGPPSSPIPLGQNVSAFVVTFVNTTVSGSRYDVQLTVSEPSGQCVNNACAYTLNDTVYIGGQQ
jgi:prepilin-type N-terminal cleavage/methylation domain-containing protein